MASKTTLNQTNLEALGAERLAALLLEISTGNANAKRRLRLELAGEESPAKLVNEIRKRLTSIANTKTFVGWRSLKAFISDLQTQRRLIVETVAKGSPADALDLMWVFLGLSQTTLERTTDTSGEVMAIFQQACVDVAAIAPVAAPKRDDLLPPLIEVLQTNGYGQADGLIAGLEPVLGPDGLAALRDRLAAADKPDRSGGVPARRTSRWKRGRKLERDVQRRRSHAQILHHALVEIADALGDIDAFVALQTDLTSPAAAAAIAERYLRTGQADKALAVLDAVRAGRPETRPLAWQTARIEALDVLGRGDDAQAFRLDLFHKTLNGEFLRAHIKRLPDFDDIEAEDAALDFVVRFPDALAALDFLIAWPAIDRAARLVTTRIADVDGSADVLPIAAERLAGRYPLAAILVLRRIVDATLTNSRTVDYDRAADDLAEARRLSAHVSDWGGVPDHEAYEKALRAHHPRKYDFWRAVDSEP